MDSWIWAGCPARPGTHPDAMSLRAASSRASWWRCRGVRVSSGPAFLPSASSNARSAAAHRGVRSPCSVPAPSRVVCSRRYRSSNPSSPLSGAPSRRRICPARPARPARSAPAAAAASRIWPASSRASPGSLPVQPPICRARDSETRRWPSAAARCGCARSRRSCATPATAVAEVTRACHISHVRAGRHPSSSYPHPASNAPSTTAWAATCTDRARSSPRRQPACTAAGTEAMSAPASQPSPASTMPTASPADPGTGAIPEGTPSCWPGPATGTTSQAERPAGTGDQDAPPQSRALDKKGGSIKARERSRATWETEGRSTGRLLTKAKTSNAASTIIPAMPSP
jgi:hypothetical protein